MSQDNQNQDPQDDLQSRSAGETDSEPQNQAGSSRPDSSPEVESPEEVDDEDRDDDDRADGSPNRRNSIG